MTAAPKSGSSCGRQSGRRTYWVRKFRIVGDSIEIDGDLP